MEWLILLAGLVIGGLAAWFLGKTQARDSLGIVRQQIEKKDKDILDLRKLYEDERVANAGLKAELLAAESNLADQRKFLEESRKALSNEFAALSQTALGSNSKSFLELAKSVLETQITDAKGDLSKRQEAIDSLLKPLSESLKDYRQQVQNLESSRKEAYGNLNQQLKGVASTAESLQKETGNLVRALSAPQARGRWGEVTLRRVVELAGMTEHCDFEEQKTVNSDADRLRPDMTVYLPGGGVIVVDSKVSWVAYHDMISASSEEERAQHHKRHANQVRKHMKDLAAKEYWSQFDETPKFVVMFIPGESFFSAAVQVDTLLIEDGLANDVIMASPTTLMALLRTVALGWRQEQLAKEAKQIGSLGSDLHDRILVFVRNFSRIGKSLDAATEAYNKSVGSLESRVLVAARRFKELGVTAQTEIPEVNQIERHARSIDAEPAPQDSEEPV